MVLLSKGLPRPHGDDPALGKLVKVERNLMTGHRLDFLLDELNCLLAIGIAVAIVAGLNVEIAGLLLLADAIELNPFSF